MSEPLNLLNLIQRETFSAKASFWGNASGKQRERAADALRANLTASQRFELDDTMSEYLGHLACAPFMVTRERSFELMESLRHSAELPFEKVFIEYNALAYRKGMIAAGVGVAIDGKPVEVDPDNLIHREGFLCQRYGDELIAAVYFIWSPQQRVMMLPFTFVYSLTDTPVEYLCKRYFPGMHCDVPNGVFALGVPGMDMPCAAVVHHVWPIPQAFRQTIVSPTLGQLETHAFIPEFAGCLRHLIVFLATKNTMPAIYTDTRPSKGFLGRGVMRPYMATSTVRLLLPKRATLRKLAMQQIALARRRRHIVSGFFRSQPEAGHNYCASSSLHVWSAKDATDHSHCERCDLKRKWIADFWRGDAALGYVGKARYLVEHDPKRKVDA